MKIFTSSAVWAVTVGNFAANWANFTLMTELPTYMVSALGFDMAKVHFFLLFDACTLIKTLPFSQTGALSALTFLVQWFFMLFAGIITDAVRRKSAISTVFVRKINTTIGLVVPSILIVIAGYIGCNYIVIVFLVTLAVAFIAFGGKLLIKF